LIEQYGLEIVQAYMTYVQLNSVEAARQMLKSGASRVSSQSAKFGENDDIAMEEEVSMDDGSITHLKT
jgi:5-oxoprolinase (ATP-hydrolysing)